MMATLKDHFDGKAIQLNEPISLPQAARPLVTDLDEDEASRHWGELGAQAFARSNPADEPESTVADCLACSTVMHD